MLGRTVGINGRAMQIIGILGPDYAPPVRLIEPDVYVPVSPAVLPGMQTRDDSNALTLIGRLYPENGEARARAALEAYATNKGADTATDQRVRPARMTPLGPLTISDAPLAVKLFPGIPAALCGLVLLIGAANVAGLLLARALGQRHELALLSALGASRRRVMQRLFADSLLLSAGGALAGLILAVWFMPFIRELTLPGVGVVQLRAAVDLSLVAFASLLMLCAGVICGMVPALAATRRDPADLLRSGSHRV